MSKWILPLTFLSMLSSCASKPKHDHAMLEKYPKCYHKNVKISKKCIEMNEAGNTTSALELENAAYPGQYK
ncbi:MAG: hypothetical protein AB7F86_04290 [Bdellovibrionales bacterium]